MSEVAGIILGLAGLLSLIAFLPLAAERVGLPFTVLLAGLGCALGAAVGLSELYGGMFPEGPIHDLMLQLRTMELSSEALLWIFLPILLFETALNIDGRALLDDLGPILTLAIVAVVLTMLAGGLLIYGISTYPLTACLLVAAIIATTDPSAVVGIFREVGAPGRLTGLVEGESLLNDAAAIALFTALLPIIASGADTIPDLGPLSLGFAWEFVGGALLGAVLGRSAALFVGRIDDGGPAEVTLSVALAYLTYGVADLYLHVSGIVAVVLAGLVFGSTGRTRIGARDWRGVSAIWAQLGFWGSSLIFVLASTVAPRNLAETSLYDLVLLAGLIAAAVGARALCLFGVVPILSLGQRRWRIDNRYKIVIVWGGVRGAITLALALAVAENDAYPADVRHLVAVLATGFVLFTLLVQATTLRPVLRWFGLHLLDPLEQVVRQRAMRLTEGQILKRVSEAAIVYGIDVEKAEEATALHRRRLEQEDERPHIGDDLLRQQLTLALATLCYRESELYVDELARGMISRGANTLLVRDVGRLLDALKEDGVRGYRMMTRRQLDFRGLTKVAAFLHRRFGLERPLALRLAFRAETLIVRRHVLDDLLLFARTRLRSLYGERVTETAERILDSRLEEVDRAIDAMRLQYPAWWQTVSGQYLSRVAVRLELDAYEKMAEDRILSPQVLGNLADELQGRLKTFEKTPRLDLGLDTRRLVAKVPILAELDADATEEISRLLVSRLALPGERIVRRGERGDAMFFIGSGAVEVVLEENRVRLGTGDFFGEMALLMRRPRQADVLALGYCQLLVLGRDAFRDFLRSHPDLMRQVRRIAEERLRAPETEREEAQEAA